MAETRPGNNERGWNDPPVFLHNASGENRTPKKTLLNKRVAYPVGSNGSSGTVNQLPGSYNACTPPTARVGLPPSAPAPGVVMSKPGQPQSSPVPPRPTVFTPPQPSNSTMLNNKVGDEGVMLETVLKKLEEIQIQLKPRVQADIKKRLAILEEFWRDGKISSHVKLKMLALAEALTASNCDEAHSIHLGLMLDYTNEVGQWMVGIKKLIYETRSLPKPVVEQETVECRNVNRGDTTQSNYETSVGRPNLESVILSPESVTSNPDFLISNPTTLISNPETAATNMEALNLNSDSTLNSEAEISKSESVSFVPVTENPVDEISDLEQTSKKVENDLPECDRVSRISSESKESGNEGL